MTLLILSLLLSLTAIGLAYGGPDRSPAPLLWEIRGKRVLTDETRTRKCLEPARRVYPLARLVPVELRRVALRREVDRLRVARSAGFHRCTPWYITAQIRAANIIGRESAGDPWPNCPDPYDGGGYTWTDTVQCENGGNWLDSPGYYRCGLQFDPMWERRFGRLCP